MATSYPEEIDDFTNPSPGQSRSAEGVEEWALFTNLHDAVKAIQTELGVNPKGSFPSVGAAVAAGQVYSSAEEPNPEEHPLWFDESSGICYFWYANAATPVWVEF